VNVRQSIDGLEFKKKAPINDEIDAVLAHRLATVGHQVFLLPLERDAIRRQLYGRCL
jgi:hypothetical protein